MKIPLLREKQRDFIGMSKNCNAINKERVVSYQQTGNCVFMFRCGHKYVVKTECIRENTDISCRNNRQNQK